jgi:glycosyltransferase involved in cell wall biosynthesis
MVPTQSDSPANLARHPKARKQRSAVEELLSPWEEFRRVIPLVSLQSLIGRPHPAVPKVAVLLCTMQGQHFLAEQLNSIATQSHPSWAIWASDDGSDDHTHAILEYYQSHWGEDRISIHAGPAEGSTANFLSLSCRVDIDADYFAYADQDDVWESDKLERAVDWLHSIPPDVPALYGSRTLLVDARNQHIGYSPLFRARARFPQCPGAEHRRRQHDGLQPRGARPAAPRR